ncbi:uncharacterized protein si:ch1073-145m9.1 isoform X1 [Megalops cyprinoides]|uniref:uncharacterized protein si:ch1073-145m9.1 isoform X1 n=1 Tax=Megalops cyprinoides TaxID=118141 RepID=UPI0018649C5C|nr:uncharacterized protein si:ch1073-145m9.1 isoform X1 [Megalops cyprinoides]
MGLEVLLYVPNVIGLDGWAARRFNQTSEFGAWLDVVVDNLGRSMLWTMLFEWGWLVSSLEWCVFVCNHHARGAQWKNSFSESPRWVQAVMTKGFKTPLGVLVIGGLHVLPVWLYGYQLGVLTEPLCVPDWLQVLGILLLAMGRVLCFAVEVWCIWSHVRFLTREDNQVERKE